MGLIGIPSPKHYLLGFILFSFSKTTESPCQFVIGLTECQARIWSQPVCLVGVGPVENGVPHATLQVWPMSPGGWAGVGWAGQRGWRFLHL